MPQAIMSLLEGYADSVPPPSIHVTPLPLSVPHLKVVRTAIGALLNASLNYGRRSAYFVDMSYSIMNYVDPVKSRLRSLEAGITIMKLSTSIYPPGSWLTLTNVAGITETVEESWNLRSGISSWSWRAIVELKEGDESA